MHDDGTCPVCGGEVGEPEQHAARIAQDEKTPWHFKLLVVLTVVYLCWRFVQLLT